MNQRFDHESLEEVETALGTVNRSLQQVADIGVKAHLLEIRDNLTGMLIALQEIRNIEGLHGRGDLTSDHYLNQRKKLARDYYTHRNEITEVSVPRIIDDSPEPNRLRLKRIWEAAKAGGSFLIPLASLVLEVVKIFSGNVRS